MERGETSYTYKHAHGQEENKDTKASYFPHSRTRGKKKIRTRKPLIFPIHTKQSTISISTKYTTSTNSRILKARQIRQIQKMMKSISHLQCYLQQKQQSTSADFGSSSTSSFPGFCTSFKQDISSDYNEKGGIKVE